MQFKNLKASELDGRVELPGLNEWIESLNGTEAALLIAAPAGTGKTAAVGAIARKLERDVMQCDLLQVFEYPDSREAFRVLLTIIETCARSCFRRRNWPPGRPLPGSWRCLGSGSDARLAGR